MKASYTEAKCAVLSARHEHALDLEACDWHPTTRSQSPHVQRALSACSARMYSIQSRQKA
jgi:hypothetical protein